MGISFYPALTIVNFYRRISYLQYLTFKSYFAYLINKVEKHCNYLSYSTLHRLPEIHSFTMGAFSVRGALLLPTRNIIVLGCSQVSSLKATCPYFCLAAIFIEPRIRRTRANSCRSLRRHFVIRCNLYSFMFPYLNC